MDHFEGKIQESIVYRIGICDDDEAFCEQVEGYLAVYARKTGTVIVTEIFLSGEAYLEFQDTVDRVMQEYRRVYDRQNQFFPGSIA